MAFYEHQKDKHNRKDALTSKTGNTILLVRRYPTNRKHVISHATL